MPTTIEISNTGDSVIIPARRNDGWLTNAPSRNHERGAANTAKRAKGLVGCRFHRGPHVESIPPSLRCRTSVADEMEAPTCVPHYERDLIVARLNVISQTGNVPQDSGLELASLSYVDENKVSLFAMCVLTR